jgi:flavodoxin
MKVYILEFNIDPTSGPGSVIDEIVKVSQDKELLDKLEVDKTKELLEYYGYEGDTDNEEDVEEFIEELEEFEYRGRSLSGFPYYMVTTHDTE